MVEFKKHSSIDGFRTKDFRIFYARPYFNVDLKREIKWHKKHLDKLKDHAKNPHKFHGKYTDGEIDEHRMRYFQEHVIDSIPFHDKILKEHEKRMATILSLMPKNIYNKISEISRENGGTPEYFVYDRKNNKYFFLVEKLDPQKKEWIKIVDHMLNLAEVRILGGNSE